MASSASSSIRSHRYSSITPAESAPPTSASSDASSATATRVPSPPPTTSCDGPRSDAANSSTSSPTKPTPTPFSILHLSTSFPCSKFMPSDICSRSTKITPRKPSPSVCENCSTDSSPSTPKTSPKLRSCANLSAALASNTNVNPKAAKKNRTNRLYPVIITNHRDCGTMPHQFTHPLSGQLSHKGENDADRYQLPSYGTVRHTTGLC